MSSSNVYKKVGKTSSQQGSSNSSAVEIQKNEIRITAQGRSRNYISYAVSLLDPSLLQKEEAKDVQQTPSEPFDTVVLKAMGKAIQKAVTIAEVLKRRVAGLHQITSIESQEIEDQYEPKEEGMDVVTKKRTVSSIVITLSKKALDTSDLGYQPPIPADQVTAPQIISAKKVPISAGGEGGAAGKRRRKFRSGATRKQQQATTTATTGAASTATTTGTTATATTTGATTRPPRVRREPITQLQQSGAAGKRRRKFRSGATRKQQQATTTTTGTTATTGAASTTATTTGTTATATTTRPPRVRREPRQQQQQTGEASTGVQQQQTGDVAQRGKSRPRGRGRGRGRGGNRGGRGQPRNTNATQSTGAVQQQ